MNKSSNAIDNYQQIVKYLSASFDQNFEYRQKRHHFVNELVIFVWNDRVQFDVGKSSCDIIVKGTPDSMEVTFLIPEELQSLLTHLKIALK